MPQSWKPHIRALCEPQEVRCNPQSTVEAEDSVIFAAVRALAIGGATLADLQPTPHGLFREDALRVAALVEHEVSGETLVERVDAPLGHRDNPLGAAERRREFRDCAVHAAASLAAAAIGKIIAAAEHLDAMPDARTLLPLLRGEWA